MATEIKKPTTFAEGVLNLWTDESNAYDVSGTGGDESSYAYQVLDTDESPSIRFHTWQAKVETYTATVLKIKWQTDIDTGDDFVHVEYTKNGGGAWADLLAKFAHRSLTWDIAEISLDANQDLTQVEIRVSSDKEKGGDGCDFRISDIWTEGEYTVGAPTPQGDDDAKVSESASLRIPKLRKAVDDDAKLSEYQKVSIPRVEPDVDDDVGLSEDQEIRIPQLKPAVDDDVGLSEFQSLRIPKVFVSADDDFGVVEDTQVQVSAAGPLTIDADDDAALSEYQKLRIPEAYVIESDVANVAEYVKMNAKLGINVP